ncbi:hypothetical protein SAY86_021162 [Trapa natans]|uniref:Cysteine-rich transmembrane domain-containing protein n=1 Tax=Trapa natans TaxID=22666 RepID=A0AAN7RFG0_TRANT|nr:hypothetical protein SAY86_021162 [Trapa natans]
MSYYQTQPPVGVPPPQGMVADGLLLLLSFVNWGLALLIILKLGAKYGVITTGYPPQGYPPQGYPPQPPQGMGYPYGPPPPGYYQQQPPPKQDRDTTCLEACLLALCCCCLLDAAF